MREHGRGKRWLLLLRWETVCGSKRQELQQLFAANRRLFKADVLREQLDRLGEDRIFWGGERIDQVCVKPACVRPTASSRPFYGLVAEPGARGLESRLMLSLSN